MLTTPVAVVVVFSAVLGQSDFNINVHSSDHGDCVRHQGGNRRNYSGYQVIEIRSHLDTRTRDYLAKS